MSIAQWPENERPREKLLQRGPEVLSDAELLAIFLRTGIKGCSAVDMGRELIGRFGSLGKLLSAAPGDFRQGSGMGPAKYAQFMAVKELARRVLAEEMQLADTLNSPQAVRQYLRLAIGNKDVEVFVVLFLNAQNRVLAAEELFRGTLTET